MEVRRTVRRPAIIQMTVKSLGQDVERSKGEMIRFQIYSEGRDKGICQSIGSGVLKKEILP